MSWYTFKLEGPEKQESFCVMEGRVRHLLKEVDEGSWIRTNASSISLGDELWDDWKVVMVMEEEISPFQQIEDLTNECNWLKCLVNSCFLVLFLLLAGIMLREWLK